MSNKEQSQKNPYEPDCGKCGLPIKKCKCLRGGDEEGNKKDKDSEIKDKNNLNPLNQEKSSQIAAPTQNKPAWMQSKLRNDVMLNYESKLSLFFKNGNLIFRVELNDEKAAQEFLKAVKNEFEKFKNQLTARDISTENFTAVLNDNENELTIHIPDPKYYNDFIEHLVANTNLLSSRNQEILQSAEEDFQQAFNPSP